MAHFQANSVLAFFVVLLLAALSSATTVRLQMKHVGTLYPEYNLSQHVNRDYEISMARFAYLSATHTNGVSLQPVASRNYPPGIFYVSFLIGDPVFTVLTVIDTGSSLTWVGCKPCKPCPQVEPELIFDPSLSNTYRNIPCTMPLCDSCTRGYCLYQQNYKDTQSSTGYLSTEQFTFDDSVTRSKFVAPNLIFGCSTNTNVLWNFPRLVTGVMGLGNDAHRYSNTMVAQLGNKFSYCINRLFDEYGFLDNELVIGNDALMKGKSTPITNYVGLYYLDLKTISMRQGSLPIDPQLFRHGSYSNVVIDTGTTRTYLFNGAYDVIRSVLKDELDQRSLAPFYLKKEDWDLCYEGNAEKLEKSGFPTLTFHFADGADLVLDTYMMFEQVAREAFCLAMSPTNGTENIIGIFAQQTYNVGYDLTSNKLYLQQTPHCTRL